MSLLLGLLTRAYAFLLRLYPREFRDEFSPEMQAVFAECLCDASSVGWRRLARSCLLEFRDLTRFMLQERWATLRSLRGRISLRTRTGAAAFEHTRTNHNRNSRVGYATWRRTLVAGSPLLLIGLGSVFSTYLPYYLWQRVFGVVIILLLFAVLGVAWLQGFPRWSYPYILPVTGAAGLGLLMTLITGEVINLVVTALFSITLALAMWWSRSFRPLRRMVKGVWQDWTLLAFGLYGLLPLATSIVFDDARPNNQTPYLALAISAGVLAALIYLRAGSPWQRMAALFGGVTLVVLMGLFDRAHFIGAQAFTYQSSGWMLHIWLLLMWLIAAPAVTVGASRFLVENHRAA